ncbi:MAG: HipA family kinase, partial [Acetobacteraceae bacterium]
MGEQLSLYPIRAVHVWNPSSSTVSRPDFATCEDGLDYCVKRDENGYPARANEWIGTWLARSVGIAVAKPAVIKDLSDKIVFGSEIYGEDTNDNLNIFQSKGLSADHVIHIWKTFAFDLFISNDDRHVNQYKIFNQNRVNR